MLVTGKKLLLKAQKGRYAVGAFNTNDLEITQAIIEAAEELKSPVIIQTTEGAIKYAGLDYILAIMKVAAKSKVNVAIHLDHGKDLKLIKKCIAAGYTSVMYDGSSLPYKENVRNTKKVVIWAHKKGVSVEAELGALQGIEDLVSVSAKAATLTNPNQALDFIKKTRVDSLAVAIGTSHGAYKFKGESKLDFRRLKEIKAKVKIPLVLHGASGVPKNLVDKANKYGAQICGAKGVSEHDIREAIKLGICKINTDTDLRIAFVGAVRQDLKQDVKNIDPRNVLEPAKQAIKEVVKDRMVLFGSVNKK